ncbi:NACHT domain-containing protein [Actinoplanes sp. CA-252034]|uniref:NACHT domain-containing protein n=1 Tax=Actinoplanes sp. CA-252034 TaxID=3239906 RepID=UPI003D958DC8
MTYEGALKLLGGHAPAAIEVLERVTGTGILLGAIAVPGAFGLVDGKQEASRLLRDLGRAATARLHGTHGHGRHELVTAAHTTIVLASLFEALHEAIGPSFTALEVTDREMLQLASAPGEIVTQTDWIGRLATTDLPLPGPTAGFEENLGTVLAPRIAELAGNAVAFFEGLRVWKTVGFDSTALVVRATRRWRELYRDAYLRLASDVTEFFVWASLGEHAATRDELRNANARLLEVLDRTSEALGQLHDILAAGEVPNRPGRVSIRGKLARSAAAVLDQPLLRSSALPPGLRFPTVAEGFVTPRFRSAVASSAAGTALSQEEWWASRPVHDDLDRFLAGYLAHPDAARRPLVVLGHPGAGKSLLAEILAARLPTERYTVVPVQLRRVNADDRLLPQIESALRDILKEQVSWGQVADESDGLTRVVILDGLDELIQATGTAQSAYLTDVTRFQHEELALGRPVTVVVTSRTIVVDRARVPDGALVLKLEDFDDGRIAAWTSAWNHANVATSGFRRLRTAAVLRHGEVARQPLLLTLLAIYHADPAARRLDGDGVSPALLYQALLDNFIHRQVADKPDRPPAPEHLPRLLSELRWRLSIAALGMFNRQRQHVSETDLERDLEVFLGRRDEQAHEFESPTGRAHQTVAGFFFVHVSRVDEQSENPRRTYEFLHATFGEYLIAERALILLDGYARRLAEHRADPAFHEAPDDSLPRALLSYQPLTQRRPILEFAAGLAAQRTPAQRAELFAGLRALVTDARSRAFGRYQRYEPAPPDVVAACAAWTANLVILGSLIMAEGEEPSGLAPAGAEPQEWWPAAIRLWQAGLSQEAQDGMRPLWERGQSQSQGRGSSSAA